MIRVAINGFGRIGRLVFRALFEDSKIEIPFINDVVPTEVLAYLLKHDSVHGRWSREVKAEGNILYVDKKKIVVYNARDPKDLKQAYTDMPVHFTVESTGLFVTEEKAKGHIEAGSPRVVITAPSQDVPMFVMGVNHKDYNPDIHKIVSNASCTTNCLAPLAKVVHENFGIIEGLMTTVHAVTATQKTVDAPSPKDLRGSRGILNNIIPSSTGAAKAVGKVIPELEGKLTGMAFRVPVADVSVVDLTVRLEKGASRDEITAAMRSASINELRGILAVTEEEVVSTDFIGSSLSSVFDRHASIELNKKFHKLIAWYDNEWGYTNRVCDLVRYMAAVEQTMNMNSYSK